MTNKLLDNKKRNHAQKILQKVSKQSSGKIHLSGGSPESKSGPKESLITQYNIIREDLVKLRDDLSRGYDLAKDLLDKGVVKDLIKDSVRL